MTRINIPPTALEAGAKGSWDAERARLSEYTLGPWEDLHPEVKKQLIDYARAACEGMLAAWPGMHHYEPNAEPYYGKHLILPLMENPDDKA